MGQSGNFSRGTALLLRVLVVGTFLGLWEGGGRAGWIDNKVLGSPFSVLKLVADWMIHGYIWPHLASTTVGALVGWLVGAFAGIVLGAVFVFLPPVHRTLDPFISLINAVPRIILAPIFSIILGLGLAAKMSIAALMVLFPSFYNVFAGLNSIKGGDMVQNVRMMGGRGTDLWVHVYLPATLSWVMSSLRVGIGLAFLGCIVGEYVGSNVGVGFILMASSSSGTVVQMLAALVVIASVALATDSVLSWVELRSAHWRLRS